MVALPWLFAVTTPPSLTDATVALFDDQLGLVAAWVVPFDKVTVAVNVCV
jgi:hypothetical protein